jgi:hypothetical protein
MLAHRYKLVYCTCITRSARSFSSTRMKICDRIFCCFVICLLNFNRSCKYSLKTVITPPLVYELCVSHIYFVGKGRGGP